MSLRRNILATYASQAFVTLVSILAVPWYIRYMGTEAYGLVGFFVMLQAWFMLLDFGLTPTVARQTARYRGQAVPAAQFRSLIRALELVFAAVATLGALALYCSAGWIARSWLQAGSLPIDQVQRSLEMVAFIVALRWMGGLYRSVITGSERLVWLGGFTSSAAALRFIGVIAVLHYIDPRPTTFFGFQLVIALVEFACLAAFAWHLLPSAVPGGPSFWKGFVQARQLIRFSLSLAFTASVWVLVTQSDKLVLSKVLPLADYGYFTVGALVASGVTTLASPIASALLPRLTRLEAERRRGELIALYRQSTQLVVVVAVPVALAMALLARPLLSAWTGNASLAAHAAPVLAWYALGNAVMAVTAFPYYLQYAVGDLKLHVIGNALYVVVLLPLIVWAARRWGGSGAGVVWLGVNALYLFAWTPWIHRRIEPALNLPWFGRDLLATSAPAAVVGLVLSAFLPSGGDRWVPFAEAALLVICMLAVGLACTTKVLQRLSGAWNPTARALAARRQ
jgi:O-antigen/teichoic acid export membrane protein